VKRFLGFWFVLLFAAIVNGQSLPWDFTGVYIEYKEPAAVQMYLESINNSPWTDQEDVGADFWYGAVTFDKCHGVHVVQLYFTKHAERECDESGTRCRRSSGLHDATFTYTLDWNEQEQAYVTLARANANPTTRWGLIAYTVSPFGGGTLTLGTVELVDGNYAWYSTYPVYTYKITPHITHRRPSGRRAVPRDRGIHKEVR
jgi:hypothetical protein